MPSVAPSRAEGATDDRRALLHARLEVYTRASLVTFVALATLVAVVQLAFEPLGEDRTPIVVGVMSAGSVPIFGCWLYLRRAQPAISLLVVIDTVFALYMGAYLGGGAYLIPDRAPNVYLPFIFVTLVVFTRVLVVPSSGRRTLVLGAVTVVPLVGAYAALAGFKPAHIDVSPTVFISGVIGLSVALVALASFGSNVIYGLRREASDAHRLGQYTLEEKLGEGGMGEVYRARHAMLRRPTAVKLLKKGGAMSKSSLVRFEREVQLTSQLSSPHIVHVYDYGTTPDGRFYYAMEYLDGVDLERLVNARGAISPARTIHFVEQVCTALAEAHDRGLIHRDIKPANIMVCQLGDRRDVVKVLDFGLAKDLSDDSLLTGSLIAGTPAFLAPETITDPKALTAAADLYAVGCTAYFLLSGSLVFDGKTVAEVCMHHLESTPKPLSERANQEVPAELETLVMQCLSKEAAKRQTARALAKDLRELAVVHPWTAEDALQAWGGDASAAHLAPRHDRADSFAPLTMSVDFKAREKG